MLWIYPIISSVESYLFIRLDVFQACTIGVLVHMYFIDPTAYRRNIRTHVDDVFGGAICSTVVCRKCLHVSGN